MERNYGFKRVPKEHIRIVHEMIELLKKHKPSEEVYIYVSEILNELASPEISRLESQTDNFDSLEDYYVNRILAYNIKPEEDEVTEWLVVARTLSKKMEMYEMCYNIQRAIDLVKDWLDEREQNARKELDELF